MADSGRRPAETPEARSAPDNKRSRDRMAVIDICAFLVKLAVIALGRAGSCWALSLEWLSWRGRTCIPASGTGPDGVLPAPAGIPTSETW